MSVQMWRERAVQAGQSADGGITLILAMPRRTSLCDRAFGSWSIRRAAAPGQLRDGRMRVFPSESA